MLLRLTKINPARVLGLSRDCYLSIRLSFVAGSHALKVMMMMMGVNRAKEEQDDTKGLKKFVQDDRLMGIAY